MPALWPTFIPAVGGSSSISTNQNGYPKNIERYKKIRG